MRRVIYEVPRWHCYLHRDARGFERAELTDRPRLKFEDELFEKLYAGDGDLLPPEQKDSRWSNWAEQLHTACDQLPAFTRLAGEVRGDALAAGSAVEALMEELGPQDPDSILQTSGNSLAPSPLRKQLGRGCEKASAAIEELREMIDGIGGVGFGAGGSTSASPQQRSAFRQLADRLRQDERLRRIALLAGRFKRIAATKQRQKVKHGAEEVTDVEQGGDITRLLPVELAKFARPMLRLALLRDLVERQAMQYRLSGAETLGRGPLVICVDKSGSMVGPKDIWATAVALALLDLAQGQRRPFALVAFDGAVKHEAHVEVGGQLPEEALFVSCSGGTNITGVVERALSIIKEGSGAMKKADVVLITDGESETQDAPVVRQMAEELGVTVLGFGIGVDPEALKFWCDEAHAITRLDTVDDSAAEALFTL